MGLRSRIKQRLQDLVRGERSTGNTASERAAIGSPAAGSAAAGRAAPGATARGGVGAPSTASSAPSAASSTSPSASSAPSPPPAAPSNTASVSSASPPPAASAGPMALPSGLPEGAVSRGRGGAVTRLRPPASDTDEEAQRLEKQRRFMDRARKGVLKHIVEAGGELHMKDMHDYSERRFFIAHRAFSDMMEFFVEQDLIDFDPTSMVAKITQSGRDFIGE